MTEAEKMVADYNCGLTSLNEQVLVSSYDEEKLSALKLYLGQKEQPLETELTAAVENLYLKAVPANVRDFIDLRAGIEKSAERKKKPKPTSAASENMEAKPNG